MPRVFSPRHRISMHCKKALGTFCLERELDLVWNVRYNSQIVTTMKLLICTQTVDKNDPILGFFHDWLETFSHHFEHIYVICLKEGVHQLPPNITVFSLGKEHGENRFKYILRFYRSFAKVFFVFRVDFVFFHMGAIYNILAVPFFFLRKFYKTQFYWWKTHGHINIVGRLATVFVDRIYTASKESFPLPSKKKYVVGHGITTNESPLQPREMNPILRILCLGRVTRVKNLEIVVEVARLLNETSIPFIVSIIGPTIDVIYKKELEAQIISYGIEGKVIFHDAVLHDMLHTVYSTVDVLLHPSKTGSIDKAVLEAIEGGVIPVASCMPYDELLGRHALCVSEDTPSAYYSILKEIHNMDGAILDDVLSKLHEEVVRRHSLSTLPQRIFNTTEL